MLQQHDLFFLVFILTLIPLGLFIISRYKIENVEKFRLAITYFGAFSVLLITYNIFINLRANHSNEQEKITFDSIQNIQKNYIDPQKGLLENYPEGYFLYASMNPDAELAHKEPKMYDPIKRAQVELFYSLLIFQSIEDFISTQRYDLAGIYCWLNTFLQWMQSSTLQAQWKITRHHYTQKAGHVIDILIKKANTLKELRSENKNISPEEYENYAKTFPIESITQP